MNWYDRGARYSIKLDPHALLPWLLPGVKHIWQFVGWHDTQSIPWPTDPDRRLDTAAHLEQQQSLAVPWALVLEATTHPDYDLPERLMQYLGRVRLELRHGPHHRDKFQVGAVVLQLTGPRQPSPLNMRLTGTKVKTDLGIENIALTTYNALRVLRQIAAGKAPLCVLAWISLMEGGNDEATIDMWKRVALQQPDGKLRAGYGAAVKLFSELTKGLDVWTRALEGWTVEESTFAKEIELRGELRGERDALLRLLRVRFGQIVPGPLHLRIQNETDLNVLHRWFETAATAASIEEWQARV